MAPDRFVFLMKDGSGFQHRLYIPKDLLDLPKFLVLQSHPGRWQVGVGLEDPFAVKTGLIVYFVLIDGQEIPVQSEILPVSLIANQGLGIVFQLLSQGF